MPDVSSGFIRKIGEITFQPPLSSQSQCRTPVIFNSDDTLLAFVWNTSYVVVCPWDKINCKPCLDSLAQSDPSSTNNTTYWRANITEGVSWDNNVCACINVGNTPQSMCFFKMDFVHNDISVNFQWRRADMKRGFIIITAHKNGRMRLWNPYSGAPLFDLLDHSRAVLVLSPAPDSSLRLVSGSLDKTVKVWEMLDYGNMSKSLNVGFDVYCVAWRPCQHTAHPFSTSSVTTLPVTRCRHLAVCGRSNQVYVYNMASVSAAAATPCLVLRGHLHSVSSCVYSPDGGCMLTSSYDTTACLWHADTGVRLHVLHHQLPPPRQVYASGVNDYWVHQVCVSQARTHSALVCSVCEDRTLRLWTLRRGGRLCQLCLGDPRPLQSGGRELGHSPVVEPLYCTLSSTNLIVCRERSGCLTFVKVIGRVLDLVNISAQTICKNARACDLEKLPLPKCLLGCIQHCF